MKIRLGFVSNSSSSSFVVAIKKKINECPHCGRSDPNILDAIRQKSNSWGDTELEGVGLDAILEYADEVGKYNHMQAEKIKKSISVFDNDEWELAAFSISYHDEVLNAIFKNAKAAGTIVSIYEDN